jgi:hypothetical protein
VVAWRICRNMLWLLLYTSVLMSGWMIIWNTSHYGIMQRIKIINTLSIIWENTIHLFYFLASIWGTKKWRHSKRVQKKTFTIRAQWQHSSSFFFQYTVQPITNSIVTKTSTSELPQRYTTTPKQAGRQWEATIIMPSSVPHLYAIKTTSLCLVSLVPLLKYPIM